MRAIRVRSLMYVSSLLLFVGIVGCSKSPLVRIENQSAVTVSNIVVTGNGFSSAIPSIAPSKTHELRVQPKGESSIRFTFDAGEKHVDSANQEYIEANGDYRVRAIIHSNLTVTVSTDLKHY